MAGEKIFEISRCPLFMDYSHIFMTIQEILTRECQNTNSICLLKDGLFWRAWERTAFRFALHLKPCWAKARGVVLHRNHSINAVASYAARPAIIDKMKN